MSEPARHSGLGADRRPGRTERPVEGHGTGRRAGRAARRLAAVCGAALALFSAVAPAAALPAGGGIRPTADNGVSAEYPVEMTIETVAPQVASPNGIVKITGHVTNTGKAAVKNAHAAVRKPLSSKPLQRRSDLSLVATRSGPSNSDGVELDSPQYALPELGPGQNQPYTLSVSVSDLGLSDSGVYELAVDAWGSTADNQRDRPLGIARTFLPYNPGGAEAQPSKVTTLWPLVHAPVLAAQTYSDNDQPVPVLRDDSLTADFSPGGRLYELVDTGSKMTGLTWVVDPDLLDTAFAMTRPYRVQKPGQDVGKPAKDDNTVPGTGQAAATAWLDKLRAAVAKPGGQVVSLPYADPDLASIAHNGADLTGMATALGKAATAGRLTVEGRLSVDTRSDVAWPYQGYLDQQIAGIAQQSGDSLVLVNGASMPEPDAMNYTPTAVRPIGSGQNAVVADETVSSLFQTDLASPQAQTRANQRFLAETYTITHEQPQNQRGLLVMPPRDLTASTAKVLADALQTASDNKWLTPVKLDTLAQASPDPKAGNTVPAAVDYPAQVRASELSAAELSSTDEIQQNLDTLMRVLTLPQRVRGPFSAAMVRSLSTEWRTNAAAGSTYRADVAKYLDELTGAVRVPKKNVVTFAGNTGLLQVSVRNDLTQTVTNLKLVLTSTQPNRLRVGKEEELVIPASQSVTLRFNAEAHNNGPVNMTAQLWTTGPNPQKYGEPQQFRVDVTSVTNGVLYVFAAAAALLLLAALRFVRQRKRRAGQPHADGDQPVDGPAAGGAQDPDGDANGDANGEKPDGEAGGGAGGPAGKGPGDGPGGGPEAGSDGGSAGAGPAQTPRGSNADGRDRTASDEKVGP
ncbi:DUF6049 family protein [Kitasatospora sp. NBC_01300]|uniref:DUF6049 family protein n=1 Tax=Kitasatospora sp. NBC_01300 TaxID=2903574 RepID=UPI00352FBFF6|nr:DUF6049 family protein [Kitasatospora sp. NBC_01300]